MKYSNPLTERKVLDKLDEILDNLELKYNELEVYRIIGELSQLLYPNREEPCFEEIPLLYFEVKNLHNNLLNYIIGNKEQEVPVDSILDKLWDLRRKYE